MVKECTVDGCLTRTRNGTSPYCETHYARWRKHGDPNCVLRDQTPAAERWKSCYTADSRTGCWNWTGPMYKSLGYGFITEGAKKRLRAHRFVYEQVVGPISAGLVLDHKCRNKMCVNPRHLEPVTTAINVRRGNAGWKNAAKTVCDHGHEFTPENTIVKNKRWRACRECQRRGLRDCARRRRGSALTGPAQHNASKTHCKHGHEYTVENTIFVKATGARTCRECGRRTSREYQARKKSGIKIEQNLRRYNNRDGYIVLHLPGHPLANKVGQVSEHRSVLYDDIGQGPHPCNWCGNLLSWGTAAGINVDHLNGESADNRLDNLVVSCRSCNRRRAAQGNAADWAAA